MPTYELFPKELRDIAHWCVYRLVPDPKNPTKLRKPPFQSKSPFTGCSSVDPSQWSTFEEALRAYENPANKLDGIGWFFTRPYFGFDLDHVRDVETGETEPWAEEFIEKYATYTELSPSRTGYHGIGHGRVPQIEDPKNALLKKDGQVKKGRVEVYGGERYFTVTGSRYREWEEVRRLTDEEVRELYTFASSADPTLKTKTTSQPSQSTTSGQLSRLQRMNLLSLGEWKELHTSQSEADLEYCCFLAEANKGDRAKTEAQFRTSKLFRSVEQGKHPGYIPSTVEAACRRYELDPNKDRRKDSQAPPSPLVVSRLDQFLAEQLPVREPLMSFANGTPIFCKQSLSQIFAKRGGGKTMFALSLAGAMAKGGRFLNWTATRCSKVLYVEGEMPAVQMQERLNMLVGSTENFSLVTIDKQFGNMIPRLAEPSGQSLIENAAKESGAEVIVIDSISSLVGIATNEEGEWISYLNWLMRMRSMGYCIIMLHHAGKGGLQRGHSRSEDPLDISIKLEQPEDYQMTDGLRTLLHFDKTRGVVLPEGVLEVRLEGNDWTHSLLQQTLKDLVLKLHRENPNWKSPRIATEAGCSTSLVNRYIREAGSGNSGLEPEQDGLGF